MCRVDGCTKPVVYRKLELCKSCYDRRRSQGSEHAPRIYTRGFTVAQKLDHYRTRDGPGECFGWRSRVSAQGYAMLWTPEGFRAAHRLAYIEVHGEIPVGFQVDHECHNRDLTCRGGPTCSHRRCTNPADLVARTRVENVRASRRTERRAVSSS